MRDALVTFHRWLALATSLFIFLIAGSGSALVFEGAMDRALAPALWHAQESGARLSLDTLAARAGIALHGAPGAVSMATEAGRPDIFLGQGTRAYIDPVTGALLGLRTSAQSESTLPRKIHRLHTDLLVRGAGGTVVALVTIASFLLLVTGIIVWWRDKLWRISWRASWKRIAYDLHHSLGIAAALVLLLVTASGIAMHYRALGKAIDGIGSPPAPVRRLQVQQAGRVLSLDSVVARATETLPGALPTSVTFSDGHGAAVVTLRFPEDRTPAGRSSVTIGRSDGTVRAVQSTRALATGKRITTLLRPIHTGDILGPVTSVIWLLAALVLASQSITGALMWNNARHGRARIRRRAPA